MQTGSIIHGTMRPQDLIPAFMDVVRDYAPAVYEQLTVCNAIPAYAAEDEDSEWWNSDSASYLIEQLWDTLNDHAPEGHYFGSHPGDGSDYGFWLVED